MIRDMPLPWCCLYDSTPPPPSLLYPPIPLDNPDSEGHMHDPSMKQLTPSCIPLSPPPSTPLYTPDCERHMHPSTKQLTLETSPMCWQQRFCSCDFQNNWLDKIEECRKNFTRKLDLELSQIEPGLDKESKPSNNPFDEDHSNPFAGDETNPFAEDDSTNPFAEDDTNPFAEANSKNPFLGEDDEPLSNGKSGQYMHSWGGQYMHSWGGQYMHSWGFYNQTHRPITAVTYNTKPYCITTSP